MPWQKFKLHANDVYLRGKLKNIKNKFFHLNSIWFAWLVFCSFVIHIWDLFFGHMMLELMFMISDKQYLHNISDNFDSISPQLRCILKYSKHQTPPQLRIKLFQPFNHPLTQFSFLFFVHFHYFTKRYPEKIWCNS